MFVGLAEIGHETKHFETYHPGGLVRADTAWEYRITLAIGGFSKRKRDGVSRSQGGVIRDTPCKGPARIKGRIGVSHQDM